MLYVVNNCSCFITMLSLESLLKDNGEVRQCCDIRKPTEVGRFSLDFQRRFHHDRRQMVCYIPAEARRNGTLLQLLDLNDGYKSPRFVKRDEGVKERLDHMLQWMVCNKRRFAGKSHFHDVKRQKVEQDQNIIGEPPDFVLWRGHLTKLMCTPFENRDGWSMACQKLENTVYVSEVETKAAAQRKASSTEREKLMTYWGVRFEGYMTGRFPKPPETISVRTPKEETIINTNEAFCSVFRTRVNKRHSVVYGAEVDCCKSVDVLSPPDCYVELKTSRKFTSRKQEENFYRYKCLKWWAQSYLAGIPQITCGFRDDDGFVESIRDFSTLDLPNRAMTLHNSWNPSACLTFLDNLLQAIKEIFQAVNTSKCTIILSWEPGDKCVSYELSHSPKDCFLHEWYINDMT
ncbi:unnamed protein product [Clavelina lepadiformis]|uniref:Decapping nuclease n=1 Tax=Clavelina lepadiformis TaxID=159417 RepID=A0ABP0F1F0_CLALP